MRYAAVALAALLFLSVIPTPTSFVPSFGAESENRVYGHGTVSYSPIVAGYNQFLRDFYYHFWDRENTIPRLRPTEGNGYVNNTAKRYTYWQIAEAANLLYWDYKIARSPDIRAMLQSQWKEIDSNIY